MEKVLTHQRVNQKTHEQDLQEAREEALKPWIEMPKSRLECCLALKKGLEYAVAEHRQPQRSWCCREGLSEDSRRRCQEQEEGRPHRRRGTGADPPAPGDLGQRDQDLPGVWRPPLGNRIHHPATNDDGEPQLRVIKGKTYNTRGGVKEETDPRWLEAVAVDGTTFDLVQNWDQLKLPPHE